MTDRGAGRLGVLAVLGAKGGVGKTSVAVNLAAALVRSGERVVLVDADPQGGASLHLGIVFPPNVAAPVTRLIGDGEDPHSLIALTSVEGLGLIAANTSLAGLEMNLDHDGNQDWPFRLSKLRELDDVATWVIIDTPPGVGRLPLMAAAIADLALVVTTYDDLGVGPLKDTMETVIGSAQDLNKGLTVFGIVGSKFDLRTSNAKAYRAVVANTLYPGLVVAELPKRVKVEDAQAAHVPLATYLGDRPKDPANEIVSELDRLAEALRRHETTKEQAGA